MEPMVDTVDTEGSVVSSPSAAIDAICALVKEGAAGLAVCPGIWSSPKDPIAEKIVFLVEIATDMAHQHKTGRVLSSGHDWCPMLWELHWLWSLSRVILN